MNILKGDLPFFSSSSFGPISDNLWAASFSLIPEEISVARMSLTSSTVFMCQAVFDSKSFNIFNTAPL